MSLDDIRSKYSKTDPTIHKASQHTVANVIESMLGVNPFFGEPMAANRTSTSNTVEDALPKVNLPRVLYGQPKLQSFEESARVSVIGMNGATSVEDIARSLQATEAFYKEGVSVVLKRGDGKMPVLVGPQVRVTSDGTELVRPGTSTEDMHSVTSIKRTSHKRGVICPEKADALSMVRPGKNGYSLLCNLDVALNHSKQNERGKFGPIYYRDSGARAATADSNPMDSSNRNVTKLSPTHIVSPNQSWKFDESNNKNIRALWEQCKRQGMVNVFFGNIYIGPYIVNRYLYQRKTHQEAHDEMIQCKELWKKLKDTHRETLLKSNDCLKNYTDKDMEMELQSLTSMGHYFELLPLDPHFLDQWDDNGKQTRRWKLVKLEEKDFVKPKFNCPMEKVDQYFGLSKGSMFDGWFSLIKFGHFSFLSEEVKDEHFPIDGNSYFSGPQEEEDGGTEEEDVLGFDLQPNMSAKDLIQKLQSTEGNFADISASELLAKLGVMVKQSNASSQSAASSVASDDDEETEKDTSPSTKTCNEGSAISLSVPDQNAPLACEATTEMAINAALHVTGAGWERACGGCVSSQHSTTIDPPRSILSLVMEVASRTCSCASNENLCLTCYEKAMNKTKLKAVLTNWTHPAFANAHEPPIYLALACTDSFKNDLSEVGMDSKWLHRNGQEYVLERSDEAWVIFFKCFICCTINSPILLQLAKDGNNTDDDDSLLVPPPTKLEEYISLIRKYKWENKFLHKHFRGIVDSTEGFIKMLKAVASCGSSVFIEAVQNGGAFRTKILQTIKKGLNSSCEINLSDFQVHVIMRCIENCIHIPFGKVLEVSMTGFGGKNGANCFLNAARADTRYKSNNKINKMTMKDVPLWLLAKFNEYAKSKRDDSNFSKVLLVLGLELCSHKQCLVHKLGIGKELDASDMEHLLCAFSSLHQRTLPCRNIVMSTKIDDDKFFPIYSDGDTLVKEMHFMRHLRDEYEPRSKAYKELLLLKEFFLSELYTVDCTHES